MSLPKDSLQGSLFGVWSFAGDLFDGNNRYRIFREKILPQIYKARNELCSMYCRGNGRPAIEPVIMAGVTLLQFMEKAPDTKAVENVKMHLGWKYALELDLDHNGFHATSLVKFRDRLLESESERLMFDAILDGLREAGLVRKKSKQRLDSTHILGCVSRMSRLEVVRETIRLFLEEAGRQGKEENIDDWATLRQRYIDGDIAWHRLSKDDLNDKFNQAGTDALKLLRWLRLQDISLRDNDKSVLLERVFLEQYELSAEGTSKREAERSGTMKNPHDPDVQWAAKDLAKNTQWCGYKLQLSETAPEDGIARKKGQPTEQFITESITTEAIASDVAGLRAVLESQAEHHKDQPAELYVDAGYVTDDTMAEAKNKGYELTGPARPAGNAVSIDFDATHFNVDVQNRKAVCPAGHESKQCSLINDSYNNSVYYRFEWAGLCDDCPSRKRCTRSRNGRRILSVGPHHDLLQKRRQEMQTEEFKKRMHQRNAIEGSISEFTRLGGRRTRYKGQAKTRLANYLLASALNVNRWIRLSNWQREQRKAA